MKLTKLLILFLFLSLKGFSQQTPSYTLKYDKTEFCAGTSLIANPIFLNNRGEVVNHVFAQVSNFRYTKKTGNGKLVLSADGNIDLSKSDAGEYQIFIPSIVNQLSFVIKIINCNN